MSTRALERYEEWDSEPFPGGYRALHDLAAEDFSGIVTAGGAKLCMLNGTVVGILDGSIEDFQDGDGTIYEAPSPALPLLALMQERNDEVKAKYYTEDNPISEVDGTLTDGNFSGYIELSENVLSGDYYLVYHAGRSMAVAFVGNSKRLLTDGEAFERGDGEVGIYQVRPAKIDPIELPEPADDAPAETATNDAGAPATGGAETAADGPTGESTPPASGDSDATDPPGTGVTPADSGGAGADEAGPSTAADDAAGPGDAGSPSAEPSGGGVRPDASPDAGHGPGADAVAGDASARTNSASNPDSTRPGGDQDASGRRGDRSTGPGPGRPGPASGSSGSNRSADQLETHSIPSLDPSRSTSRREERTAVASMGPRPEGDRAPGETETQSQAQPAAGTENDPSPAEGSDPGPGPDAGSSGAETDPRGAGTGADARIRELEAELTETSEELDRVEAQLEEVRDERDDLRRERDDLADEREALEAEIANLEAEVERLNSQLDGMEERFGASPDAEQRLAPAEALDQTDIFVRYESKGQATLETAHQGNASRQQVNENLGLEYHTQFDAASTAVAGKSFDAFLGETIQFRFVRWVVEDLLYEVQDTGKVAALRDLYDAVPRIDRAELNGTVNAEFTEDGGDRRTQESFDVVLRDRMGNPLFVANMNDSRQAATESMMTSLVTAASHVGESTETLGTAFLVTSSFFEPEALETAAEATSGGLLSRDKRESFVKLSRKRGYHLCLVEAREGKFHLAVPEL